MSRLPVRSPLPKRVPSTRSAPASRASSVAATPVPRSLCVCTLMIAHSRRRKFRQNHFDRIWKIENNPVFGGRLPDVCHGFADLERKLHFGGRKAFWRILEGN